MLNARAHAVSLIAEGSLGARGRRTLSLAAVVLLLGAAPAAAAPTWLSPASPPSWLGSLELSASTPAAQNAFDPDVAAAPSGDAIVVWHRFDGARPAAQWTVRRAGGSFAPAAALSPSGEAALDPRVGVDGEGAATTVWRGSQGGGRSLVRAATRPAAGGTFGAPTSLSLPDQDAREPDLAVAPNGAALAVWSRFDGSRHVIEAAARPAGGIFGPAERVSEGGENAEEPRVEIDAEGRAIVAWSRRGGGGDWVVQARSRSAAGAFGGVETLSSSGADAGEVDVGVAGDGSAAVVWTRAGQVQAATRSASGSFGAASDLSAAVAAPVRETGYRDPSARDPRVAIDADGAATAAWTRFDGTAQVVQAATRSPGGGWSSPSTISSAGVEAEQPQLAVDGRGDVTALWARVQGIDRTVQAARNSGGSFGSPTAISASGQGGHFPRLAFDSEGNATAAWFHTTTSIGQAVNVQGAGFDAVGPELRDLRVPPAGSAGATTAFSVSPFDVWSPAATSGTSWDFGDGSSSTGTSVSHTYATPGTYTVRVSSTDAVGNVTSTTRPVEVAPAGTPGTGAGEPPPATTTTTPEPPPPSTTTPSTTTTPDPPPPTTTPEDPPPATTTTTTTPAPPPATTTPDPPPPTTSDPPPSSTTTPDPPPPTSTTTTEPAPPPASTTSPPPPPTSTTQTPPPTAAAPAPAPPAASGGSAPSGDGGSAGSSEGAPAPAPAPPLTPLAPSIGPPAAPNVSVSVPPAGRRIRTVLSRGLRVRMACSEACTVSSQLVLTRGRIVAGRGSRRLAPRQSTEVLLRLTPRGRATLRRTRRAAAVVRTGVADGTGNATPTATRFVLRR